MAGNDSYTVSLLHMNGADASVVFTDGAFGGTHTWTTYGNAQIDTAQSKFGGASGLFDGAGDYIDTPDSTDWTMGSGDFTVDAWIKIFSLGAQQALIGQCNSGGDGSSVSFDLLVASDSRPWGRVYYGGMSYVHAQKNDALSANTWYHIALVRYGANLTIYVNGVPGGTVGNIGTQTLNDSATKLAVGRVGEYAGNYFNGWIDELRISKGIARWTADFSSSLPTGEYGSDPTNYPRAVAGAVGWVGGTVKRLASAKRKITGAIYDSLRTQKDILENLIPDPHRAVKNMESLSQAFKGGQGWELCPRYSR